ncbi:hypothetical protein PF005_g19831 [Phytophthora fragariae]|uniref:Uncharacterized protein n=2 Tax=Phytophthora fragariae TaxID=53985 RepID=A0A6A3EBT2_9STRA|nr:hypothetical protein PF009_g19899 [Phytophthora fragariae]KAE9188998.1 hypothetical protein PF005_g19831 [Phytophthora fragariae]KAE9205695.1 hypothetical protein PF002_g20244 [Phytophthora fragariae]KAE9279996.1 hypothetical protein PF001_g24437 [Phytophthora fragariae]
MASFIKLDSTNLVQNGYNNTWRYEFAGSSVNFVDTQMAIQSISLYASDFNIDGLAFGNTSFKIEVPTAGTTSTISVTLSDGWYSYADINRNIQTALVSAGAYLIDGSGNNVYFIQLEENSTYYACQVDCSPTPTAIGTYTRPASGLYSAGGTGLPTTTRVPRLNIDNAAFGSVLGFTTGTYPAASSTTAVSLLSNTIPQVHPSSSYIVRCDIIKNDYVVTGDILAAFDRGGASIGQIVRYQPSNYAWVAVHNGPRSTITIRIYNQNDQPVHFRDKSVSTMLLFKPMTVIN